MSNYHGRIMNIQTVPESDFEPHMSRKDRLCYKEGHRDARHAAAEIALEADERINIHEYTAQMSLVALEFYVKENFKGFGDDQEPIEHHYAMKAMEEIDFLLSKLEQEQNQ
jgi:hypothetical protein